MNVIGILSLVPSHIEHKCEDNLKLAYDFGSNTWVKCYSMFNKYIDEWLTRRIFVAHYVLAHDHC